MPALDTNVLVRFVVADHARQHAAATALLTRAASAGEPLFVPVTVALELEWVLRSAYRYDADEVVALFGAMLDARELTFENETAIELALSMREEHGADFADCLHTALAWQSGHAPLLTFDRAAAQLPHCLPVG